ncbi:MAG: MarR family transcriptional regulator [Lachnospiraceae bacterium]|nr:MarR family transcriptional regulator [Lachnospiraceae bacterium]
MGGYFSRDMERLNYLLSEIDEVYHDAGVRLGVSDGAMKILYTLCVAGDRCLLCDVARLSGSSRKTIHSAVKKLVKEGIVSLEAKNGRDKLVCLTEDGRALIKQTAQKVIEIENAIFDSWESKEREEYLRLLSKYLNDLKERVKEL